MKLTVKLGGVAASDPAVIALLAEAATPEWVVVHGGGPEITDWSDRLGLPSRVVDGLRFTDDATLEVVTAVLRGVLSTRLVAAFCAAGTPAVGVSGVDAAVLEATADPQLGLVGHVTRVDVALFERLAAGGLLPIVAPLAVDRRGQVLNVNADEAAGAIAAARRGPLLLLTDVPGVERHGRLVGSLGIDGAEQMLAEGSASGGMRPKLRAAITAAAAGCNVRIVDGRSATAVRAALTGETAGTQLRMDAGVAPATGGIS